MRKGMTSVTSRFVRLGERKFSIEPLHQVSKRPYRFYQCRQRLLESFLKSPDSCFDVTNTFLESLYLAQNLRLLGVSQAHYLIYPVADFLYPSFNLPGFNRELGYLLVYLT